MPGCRLCGDVWVEAGDLCPVCGLCEICCCCGLSSSSVDNITRMTLIADQLELDRLSDMEDEERGYYWERFDR